MGKNGRMERNIALAAFLFMSKISIESKKTSKPSGRSDRRALQTVSLSRKEGQKGVRVGPVYLLITAT